MILDGKAVAQKVLGEVREGVARLRARAGVTPTLAVVLVGDFAPSRIYVANKKKAAESVGIASRDHLYPAGLSRAELRDTLAAINADPGVQAAGILDRVADEASEAGVDEAFAREFFQKQFDASKHIQRRLHHQWLQEGRSPFASAPDLAEDVRPVLDRLTPQLIESLSEMQRIAEVDGASRYLAARADDLVRDDFDGEPRAMALEPLMERMAR